MAENSRMSKLSEKEDECIFSWKLFTGWDFMIGNAETAHNRIASVILGFKEALLEEAEKKKNLRNWRIISLRGMVNICVVILLAVSAYAVVTVVSRSDDSPKARSWWRENETTIVVTLISITFPVLFELLGLLEHYHPRKQLRLQLARIMLLNLLNLYSLIFALFTKIGGMSIDLNQLKPVNDSMEPNMSSNIIDPMFYFSTTCYEEMIECDICKDIFSTERSTPITDNIPESTTSLLLHPYENISQNRKPAIINDQSFNSKSVAKDPLAENLVQTQKSLMQEQLEILRNLASITNSTQEFDDPTLEELDIDYFTSDDINNTISDDDNGSNSFRDYVYNPTSIENSVVNTKITSPDDEYYTTSSTESYTDFIIEEQNSSNTDIIYDWTNNSEETSEAPYSNISTITIYKLIINNATTNVSFTLEYSTESTTDVPDTTAHENEIYSNDYTTENMSMHKSTYTDMLSTTDSSTTEQELFTPDYEDSTNIESTSVTSKTTICPNFLNSSINCNEHNITQVFVIDDCKIIAKICYRTLCNRTKLFKNTQSVRDIVYIDNNKRKMYNLTDETKKKLEKLCWETLFGQELVKLTMMDLVFVLLGTLFMDFFRALFVRYMNRCWCWDLEKKFPEYGDFKIAENILHLINNQGMVWMGMFFSPGLVVLNVVKLMVMMYLKSWAVMTCNVPHEVVFRVSKSNNFYLALLLTMLFLCVLPVGYAIVWITPSWHCGPFSEHKKIYHILTNNIYKILPKSLNFPLEYMTSPAIVIPLLVLLILIIYYLISLTNSLREANNDLKAQLRRERTEERRKMFKLADKRVRAGSAAVDSTPFSRWKKALPSLPIRSIDSDENKTATGDGTSEPQKITKKRGGIFAKIVGMALDKKSDIETMFGGDNSMASPVSKNNNDDSDTDFHESLPKEILTIKDIVFKSTPIKKKNSVEFKTDDIEKTKFRMEDKGLKVKMETIDDRTEKKAILEKQRDDQLKLEKQVKLKSITAATEVLSSEHDSNIDKKLSKKQTSESSNQSRQSDSVGSVIPVITISATESDEELLQAKKDSTLKNEENKDAGDTISDCLEKIHKSSSDIKSLRRQSSVESINEQRPPKENKPDGGHKYQYSL